MDWTSFFFGAISGIVAVFTLFAIGTVWWMRPYLKAARTRVKQVANDQGADSSDVQARVMAHLWETQAQAHEQGWGGNNPWKHWAKKKKRNG